jgi:quercetin dioxygenase-like cupin family protein
MKNEIIRVGQISIRFLMEGVETNGTVSMFESTVPAGAKVPVPHYHKDYDETAYGLQGIITFILEGKTVNLGPGDSCFIPRGAVHSFKNLQDTEAKALAVITPGLLGPDYFRELAVIINPGSPPDVEKVKAVMLKHGIVPVVT